MIQMFDMSGAAPVEVPVPEATSSVGPPLGETLQTFLYGERTLIPTAVSIGLCGELTGTLKGAPVFLASCCMIRKVDQEDEIYAHQRKHGGCDTAILRGTIVMDDDGRLRLEAQEVWAVAEERE